MAVVISAIVIASFGLFAAGQAHDASAESVARLAAGATAGASAWGGSERVREQHQGRVHELIDDANDIVTAPFTGLVAGQQNIWVRQAVPAVLALLVFGFGLSYLARWLALTHHPRTPAPRGRGSSGSSPPPVTGQR